MDASQGVCVLWYVHNPALQGGWVCHSDRYASRADGDLHQRRDVPRDGQGGRPAAAPARRRRRLPRRADLLRAADGEHRLPRRGGAGRPHLRRRVRRVRRRGDAVGSCAGSARHQHAIVARRSGDAGLAAGRRGDVPEGPRAARSSSSTCSASRTSARTSRTASPTTRPATRCGCSASATGRCGCCATVRGLRLVDLPGAEECCGFGGTFAVKNADTSVAMGVGQGPARARRPAPRCWSPGTTPA